MHFLLYVLFVTILVKKVATYILPHLMPLRHLAKLIMLDYLHYYCRKMYHYVLFELCLIGTVNCLVLFGGTMPSHHFFMFSLE